MTKASLQEEVSEQNQKFDKVIKVNIYPDDDDVGLDKKATDVSVLHHCKWEKITIILHVLEYACTI